MHHPRSDIITDPQLVLNGTVQKATHPHAGAMQFARPAARFGDADWALTRHAPLIGEHNKEIMRELVVPAARIDELCAKGVLRAQPGVH